MGCSLSLPDAMRDEEGMTASDMLRWMIRFHLSVRSSHEANAKWCQWGDFVPPERDATAEPTICAVHLSTQPLSDT